MWGLRICSGLLFLMLTNTANADIVLIGRHGEVNLLYENAETKEIILMSCPRLQTFQSREDCWIPENTIPLPRHRFIPFAMDALRHLGGRAWRAIGDRDVYLAATKARLLRQSYLDLAVEAQADLDRIQAFKEVYGIDGNFFPEEWYQRLLGRYNDFQNIVDSAVAFLSMIEDQIRSDKMFVVWYATGEAWKAKRSLAHGLLAQIFQRLTGNLERPCGLGGETIEDLIKDCDEAVETEWGLWRRVTRTPYIGNWSRDIESFNDNFSSDRFGALNLRDRGADVWLDPEDRIWVRVAGPSVKLNNDLVNNRRAELLQSECHFWKHSDTPVSNGLAGLGDSISSSFKRPEIRMLPPSNDASKLFPFDISEVAFFNHNARAKVFDGKKFRRSETDVPFILAERYCVSDGVPEFSRP